MTECPRCGNEASATAEIEIGDRWRDKFGKPPHSFFSKYRQVHVSVDQTGTMVAYCHSVSDLQYGPF